MPTTVNSDLIIYDDLAQTAFLERRQDNLAILTRPPTARSCWITS